MNIEELLDVHSQLYDIAQEYADLLYEYGGALYRGVHVCPHTKTFSFDVGPSTHGMSKPVSLPLSLLEDPKKLTKNLNDLADKQKAKWREITKRNTCQCCGHVAFPLEW